MMRVLLVAFMFVIIPTWLHAQKDTTQIGSIMGIVKDSADDYALQAVTITLYKAPDSTLLNYKITGDDGAFHFTDLPLLTPLYLNFSFTGYNTLSKKVTLDSANKNYDLKNVLLSRRQGEMEEVVVKAVIPITMNGDTLEINPGAFKLDSNAVVEDMLRRVPGITMWGDGTITVNGKVVNNVYVDGKPFFGNDPALATQNLPKNAIDKIQVYREEDYSKDNFDDNPADSLLTMNIKLRADKRKGYFGKAGAGIGTDRRYEADASVLGYTNKLRGGLAGSINNINKTAEMQEMFRQSTYRNYNPNNRYVANFGSAGINKVLTLGGNMQYNFMDDANSRFSNLLTASYNFRTNNNFVTSNTDSRNSASSRVFLQESEQESNSRGSSHRANVGYNKRDAEKDLNISASFNASENDRTSRSLSSKSEEDAGLVSRSASATQANSSSNSLNFSTSFRNKDDDDRNLRSFGLNYNLSYSESKGESNTITDFVSFEDPSQNRYFNRLNLNNSSSFTTSLGANYNALKRLLFGNFNLWGINMVVTNNISFSRSNDSKNVSDYDSLSSTYITNDSLTNYLQVVRVVDRPALRLSKNFTKRLSDRFQRYINLAANIQGQFLSEKTESDIIYRNLDRSFRFFTPSASVSYNYQRFNRYTVEMNLSGNRSSGIPSIDQLRPIIDSSVNTYAINLGNPNLRPYQTNALDFTFNYRREQSARKADYHLTVNAGMNSIDNAITDSSYYDNSGRRTTYLINMSGRRVYSGGLNARTSIKLKNNKVLQFSYAFNISNTTSPNYVDAIYTVSKANNIRNNIGVFYTLGDYGTIDLSQTISTNSSVQTGNNLRSLKAVNYITNANINLNPIKDLTISNSIDYVKNSTTGQSSTLWNAFVTYRFLSTKQAEVKFSAMDILKQNKNIVTTAGVNNLSTTVSNGLRQFFMVTLSYYPRRFGGGRSRGARVEGGSELRERRPEMRRPEPSRSSNIRRR